MMSAISSALDNVVRRRLSRPTLKAGNIMADETPITTFDEIILHLTDDAVVSRELLTDIIQSANKYEGMSGTPDLGDIVYALVDAVMNLESQLLHYQGKRFSDDDDA
jgi:hypothetical protein